MSPLSSAARRFLSPLAAACLAIVSPASAQPLAGPDLQVLKCEESRVGPVPGKLVLRVTVRNGGSGQTQDATLNVKLLDAAGAFAGSAWARLDDGAIAPGAEETFVVTLPNCPAYRRLVASAVWTTGFIALGKNDFTREPRVEMGECVFRRFSNGDLLVAGKVRNGRETAVRDVALTLSFKGESGQEVKSATRNLKGAIPPGAVARFLWRIPECPEIASFSAALTGRDVEGAPEGDFRDDLNAREDGLAAGAVREKPAAAAPAGDAAGAGGIPAPAAKKDDATPAGQPPAAKPDARAPAKPEAPPVAEPAPPPYTITVEGLEWVTGTFRTLGSTKNMKYTGDTAFLKLKFADAKDAPAQPEAVVTVKVSDRGQNMGFSRRPVTKAAWKLDAEKINKENASPDIVAWHARDGALWVGLVNVADNSPVDLTLDVSVEIKKAGTWGWKGLRHPFRTPLALSEPGKKQQ